MKIFISFNSSDISFVDRLTKELRNIGVIPIEINLQRTLGKNIFSGIDQILHNTDYAIVVLSKAYAETNWFTTELYALMSKEGASKNPFVIPIIAEDCNIPEILEERICADFRTSFEEGLKQLTTYISDKRHVFVVMKFGDKILDSAYKGAIKVVAEEFKYSVLRIDEIQDSGVISTQILQHIERSELVLADLTGDKPNCYYEVGYAHALGKEIILTRYRDLNIPFDLAGNRFILWETEEELRVELRKRFEGIQNRAK